MDLVDFSGPKNQKTLVLKDKNFLYGGSTKVHKLFFLTLQNLMDFSGPKNQKIWVH